jgi:hypothetical protein
MSAEVLVTDPPPGGPLSTFVLDHDAPDRSPLGLPVCALEADC